MKPITAILALAISALSFGQSSQATFVARVKDGLHQPSRVERFTGAEPVEIRGDLILSDVELDFPLWIHGGHVQLSNVKAPSIILSQVSGVLDGVRFGAGDIALSLIRCNDLTVRNIRTIGPNRIALQSMPGDAWTFSDTLARSIIPGNPRWKPENVWKPGTNLGGHGPNGVDPVIIGNGTNRVKVAAPAWPDPGWFQYSTPRAKDGVVMIHGLPEGMVRWVAEDTLEMVGGTFELGRQYRYNSYHQEFLCRNITIEDSVFDGYSLAGVNTFFTKDLLIRRNRFYVAVPDDGTIIPEDSFGTSLLDNIRVPREPRQKVAHWDHRSIGFISMTVNATALRNVNLQANAQHRTKPFYGYQGDPLNWVGGESPWVKDLIVIR